MGGGSGEIAVVRTRNPDRNMDSYRIWYSAEPGATEALLATIAHDLDDLEAPAFGAGGYEGPRSPETCFTG